MLRWLQQKLPKAAKLWLKLWSIATGMHICLLFLLFFIYKGDSVDLTIEINRNLDTNALIVFMPLHKKINQPTHPSGGKKGQAKPINVPKAKEKKPLLLAKNDTTKAPTALAPEPIKKSAAKKTVKKESKKNKKKTETQKDKKIETQKKEELKKEEVKKEKTPPTLQVPSGKSAPKDTTEDLKPTDTLVQEINENDTGSTAIDGANNIRYIGQAELDAMCLQDSLSNAIAQHWKPPVGVPKNKVCQLMLVIDWQGTVKDIKIEKPSGVAMYDVSARAAALAAEYPKGLWGKACTITFRQ